MNIPRTGQFNESVGIDIFEVKDKAGVRYSKLIFFVLERPITKLQSSKDRQLDNHHQGNVLKYSWKMGQIFGTRTEVIPDRANTIVETLQKDRAQEELSIIIRNIGVESPEQLGRVDRHG